MHKITIDVAKEFTDRPFGRYREDGERSAEVFREDILIPAMRNYEYVSVELSGTNYYGSSFLEETFGGLVRKGFTEKEINQKLDVVHNKLRSIEKEIKNYISKASECQH